MLLVAPDYLDSDWYSFNPYFAGIADNKLYFTIKLGQLLPSICIKKELVKTCQIIELKLNSEPVNGVNGQNKP